MKCIIFLISQFLLQSAFAEVNRVKFPENMDRMVHYGTLYRGEVTEHFLTTIEAMAAIKNKKPVPDGTPVVLVDYRGGKVHRYFVMQKGKNWGNDYDSRRRTGDWQFQWFWADKKENLAEDTRRCQSCHQPQESDQYLFTGDRIPKFSGKPIE